jgi:hypothetical protein
MRWRENCRVHQAKRQRAISGGTNRDLVRLIRHRPSRVLLINKQEYPMRKHRLILLLIVLAASRTSNAKAYPVGPALPLDKLAEQSDFIAKVQAVASEETKDETFTDYTNQGFAVFATKLKVISVLKGDASLAEISFHHYDDKPNGMGRMFSPQVYHFTPGQCYLLFAKKSDDPKMFRTFALFHTMQEDQGLIRAADAAPLGNRSVKEAIWHELTSLTASKDPADVIYAIKHLDRLSSQPAFVQPGSKEEYPRKAFLAAISPLLANDDPAIAAAALGAIGGSGPYWSDDPRWWLASVGKGKLLSRGLSTFPTDYFNSSAHECREQLLNVASSKAAPQTRSQAIRALGRSRKNEADTELLEPLRAWTGDDEPAVRAAAVMLWSDFPSREATVRIHVLASDKSPIVRAAAAYAIGCLQLTDFLPQLDQLLDDEDAAVARAAAISLISFDPKRATAVLKGRLSDERYFVPFANALAEGDPAAYRDELVRVISSQPNPAENLTSQMPEYTAWEIMMGYISGCNVADIRSGKLDKYVDALESPPNIGSGPYQTLYRFYNEHQLRDRMESFRQKAIKKNLGYDIDVYFKQIDGRQ